MEHKHKTQVKKDLARLIAPPLHVTKRVSVRKRMMEDYATKRKQRIAWKDAVERM